MNFLIKKPGISLFILFFLLTFLPSKAVVIMWEQDDWSGGRDQDLWRNSTMYYAGSGIDPWEEPGLLKLSRWNDCGDLEATGVHSFCGIGDTLYTGTGNSGYVYMSTDDGASWSRISCTLAGAQKVNFLLPYDHIIYAGVTCYYGGTYHGKVFKISNGGANCDTTGTIPAEGVFSLLRIGDTLYAGTGTNFGDVYKCVDGSTWVNTGDLPGAQSILALLWASDGSLWAAGKTSNKGGVWRSANGGDHWDLVSHLDACMYSLIQDEFGAIYAGTAANGHIFKTVDNGVTWDTTQLDPHTVYSLLKAFDGSLFAGTRSGYVYRSTDGNTWLKTGYLSGSTVWTLFQASDSLIYAGTSFSNPIFKFGPFRESGWVESSIFDTRCNLEYGSLNWFGSTGITFKVRTSPYFDMDWMDWEDCDPVIRGEDVSGKNSVEDGDRFVQYMAELKTWDPQASPILDLVQLNFTTVTDETSPVFSATSVLSDTAYPGPFQISSVITDEPCCVDFDSVYLYWSADGWATENEVHMVQSGDTFSAEVPRLPEGDSLWYYIRACDLAWEPNFKTDPPQGQDTSFVFWIIVEPPRIVFFPKDECLRDTDSPGPYPFRCKIVDLGTGVDELLVKGYWRYGWGRWQSAILTPLAHSGFRGVIPPVPDPTLNTKIDFYVEACDLFDPPQCAYRPPSDDPCSFYYIAAGDVGPLEILGLPQIVCHGFTYRPSAYVANRGEDLVPSFDVWCQIFDEVEKIWECKVRTSSSLSGGEVSFVEFGEWTAPIEGEELWVTVFTKFGNDSVSSNDTLSMYVEVGVEETAVSIPIPKTFGISQNYPNPFSSFSVISYQVPDMDGQSVPTLIRIYDATGKIVKILVDEPKCPGYHTISWDGRNNSGSFVPSGIYFCKINARDFTSTRKMTLLR